MHMTTKMAGMVAICCALPAGAQTETPTATPTSTPIPNREGALAQGYTCGAGGTCPTPPCDLPAVPAQQGHKTVSVGARGEAPSVSVICRPVTGWLAPEATLAALTGATCTTKRIAWLSSIPGAMSCSCA